ncbi:MAG: hypothetical protein OHK0031_08750 [Anaerolineales bacterium]
MRNLIAFPVLALALLLQMAVFGRISLLSGAADVTLLLLAAWSLQEQVDSWWLWALLAGLMNAFVSGLPLLALPFSYLIVAGLARLIQRQVWRLPILAMFTVTLLGTLAQHLIVFLALKLAGSPIGLGDVLAFIALPSLFLNFLLAFPAYAAMRDLAGWVYPSEDWL